MMITTPSAPGGAGAATTTLPGIALNGAAIAPSATATTGAPAAATADPAEGSALPPMFAQLLDFASLALPGGMAGMSGTAGTTGAGGAVGTQAAGPAAESDTAVEEMPADMSLAAMMPALHFALPLAAQPQVQAAAASFTADRSQLAAGNGMRGATLLAGAADSARQAAADAITATTMAAASPLAARLMGSALPVAADTAGPRAGAEARQPSTTGTGTGTGATTGTGTATAQAAATTVLAAQDATAQSGQDGQSGQSQGDGQGAFRAVMAGAQPAGATDAMAPADTVRLAGKPDEWQQPLRAALGDRLQVSLQKGNDQAVIRLEPPNLGTIEISIRQSAGALHVSMSATHGEVVRQLNAVGDSMRQELSQRQGGDVAVTVTQSPSRSLADGQAGGRQPERDAEQQREQRGPGRALTDADDTTNTTFALARE
ncbi:MAG TPA: flagellar hook-length control protein FliK [Pseudoduganella sp.]|jgi:flagellar hook-length control protein FliK